MKIIAFISRMLVAVLGAAALAAFMLALPGSTTRPAVKHHTAISASLPSQLADGSESNGGKGGKGSHISGIA